MSAPKVTERSTKNEIFDAYHALLRELDEEVASSDTQAEDQRVIEAAKEETVKKILGDLSNLKLESNQAISSLTDRLAQEAERLSTLQKAIAISQKELEEISQMKIRAGMLKTMIEFQKKKEEEFEEEFAKKKNEWEEEQKNYEGNKKRERAREEEEYEYQFSLKKKRDLDLWNEEKRKHEKALVDEKEARRGTEQELAELRKKVTEFPAELDRAVKEAVVKAVAEAKKEAQMRENFAKQEAQTAEKIANLKIASLEATVKYQSNEIMELKRQLEAATRQVKDIAVAVIEGSNKDTISSSKQSPTSS